MNDEWVFLGFDRFSNMKHLKCNNCGCDMFLEFTSYCPNCGIKKKEFSIAITPIDILDEDAKMASIPYLKGVTKDD